MRHSFRLQSFTAARCALACAAVLALILAAAQSAPAAFPGANGAIGVTHCRTRSDATASGSYELWLMDADGANQHQLVADPGSSAGYPATSADGRWIAF